jgi:hypothetical protein
VTLDGLWFIYQQITKWSRCRRVKYARKVKACHPGQKWWSQSHEIPSDFGVVSRTETGLDCVQLTIYGFFDTTFLTVRQTIWSRKSTLTIFFSPRAFSIVIIVPQGDHSTQPRDSARRQLYPHSDKFLLDCKRGRHSAYSSNLEYGFSTELMVMSKNQDIAPRNREDVQNSNQFSNQICCQKPGSPSAKTGFPWSHPDEILAWEIDYRLNTSYFLTKVRIRHWQKSNLFSLYNHIIDQIEEQT